MQFCTSRQFAHSFEERLAKVFAILGAVLFVLGSSPVQSRAGDFSAQPADNLSDHHRSTERDDGPCLALALCVAFAEKAVGML